MKENAELSEPERRQPEGGVENRDICFVFLKIGLVWEGRVGKWGSSLSLVQTTPSILSKGEMFPKYLLLQRFL